ncbi:hypothetical protein Cpap_2409 [Ruminiclostridium papyrosolvens DSM 2782]|uniref:Uncharacterized protein n=1 Tax=Ruminiclostridium papyrosolvens DSM 2782 TaxID=588581 RepID=F1TB55_9FIRM|nr:hypothetical protein [Ruminiclostridium papyrosolvens]EGD48259.1 hypothetical protein Cpap_2409 [Ruminiclostridium papyrosolvens DSM 2782]WES34234.1 hypothetical protein P0092_21155 [Ruminiclostridium papyrosolvens DSM 2782]
MDIFELIAYLKETEGYIEYSFYKHSSEIMNAISNKGIDEVLNIISMREIKKGAYECVTTWEVDNNSCFNKTVIIDISNEMLYITETVDGADSQTAKANLVSDFDALKEYSEIIDLMKSKQLNSIEKELLTKVVAAFFK